MLVKSIYLHSPHRPFNSDLSYTLQLGEPVSKLSTYVLKITFYEMHNATCFS